MKNFIKNKYNILKSTLKAKPVQDAGVNQDEVIQFKKNVWQTDEMSKSFIKGTDADTVVAAKMMDKEVNEYFLSECKKGDKVLDIGCGHGIVSIFLAEHGINVAAVDISEKLLAELKRRINGKALSIEIKQGDAYNIPYESGTFDTVVARMFLPHFPDWPVVLKEMTRVTKSGGKLLVHFPSGENRELGKKLAIKDCDIGASPDINNKWNFYAETNDIELKKVSRAIGLQLVQRIPISFFLNNCIIGHQLGTDKHNEYMKKVQQFLEDEKVRDFVLWFDKEVTAHSMPWISRVNIVTFKKL